VSTGDTFLRRALTFLSRKERPSMRQPCCPSCLSERTASTIPPSPEVHAFRCLECQHEWEQLIRTPMPHWSDPID